MTLRPLLLLLLVLTISLPAAAASPVPAPRRIELRVAGVDARVRPLACGIARLPDGRVYDWRCTDVSNRVLLAHAWGAFHALSRAYDRGVLTRGRILRVTGRDGVVRRYRLRWTRVMTRDFTIRGVSWWERAFGPTVVPSITLVTCRGATSDRRLVVRFELVTAR
jgi:hypothetical protein